MAQECALASFSNRWSKELALFFMCLCDSEKDFLKKRVITALRADNLDYLHFKKEYLKINFPFWSSYRPCAYGGQEYRAVYVTNRLHARFRRQTVLGSQPGCGPGWL